MKKMPSFEELQKPLPFYSPKNLVYALVRALLKTVGNIANGVGIGNKFGYDSGVMLDYVYKNQASGKLLVGKLMDRSYLNAVGWRGIRLRKVLIKEYLERVVQAQLEKKSSIRYLDIACGGGEYDIEVLEKFDQHKIQAELRDYKLENIEKARQNAQARGLQNIRFQQADAFDPQNYREKWDVIVSSGFWEIIDNDDLVKGCLLNAAKCLDPGSVLVFTIQPYHPQLEFIARTLVSNTGQPWIMRLRSLDLFKAWMKEAQLQYVSHQMEKHGIFGVVEAVKV
ncbi:class I SAM-dependent methyltransferase family protein [candidate division KSB1 bacterium]|nr:class I SAM-dependent methyltransferase family protein [candidate division KSB1 bacterium]